MPETDRWTRCQRLEATNRRRVQDGATMGNKSPFATSPPGVRLTANKHFPITSRSPVRFREGIVRFWTFLQPIRSIRILFLSMT